MGNYNPRSPYVLGEEWVPMRDENIVFSPAVADYEQGHGFTLGSDRQVQEARYYARNTPAEVGQILGVNVYPAGYEDRSGPLRRLIIPCNNGAITGTAASLSGASTVAGAVAFPGDGSGILFTPGLGTSGEVTFFFAVNSAIELLNKRIVGVNILYVMSGPVNSGSTAIYMPINPYLKSNATFIRAPISRRAFTGTGEIIDFDTIQEIGTEQRMKLGAAAWWTSTADPTTSTVRNPYTWTTLRLFEASAPANRTQLYLHYDGTPTTPAATHTGAELHYLAMEVIYCEEARVAFGGRQFGASAVTFNSTPYVEQVNIVPVVAVPALTANPILPAGDYTITAGTIDTGDIAQLSSNTVPGFPITDSRYPDLNALRQLYAIPPHPGVRVNVPFPPEDQIGAVFQAVETAVLPQLSMHATGGTTLTEPHAYGRQGAAQVYGANTATQEIYDDIVGVATTYPQVRFYARRFGDTTIPLALTGTGSLSGSTASVTVSEFDLLTDIIDGWKEITLRFAAGTEPVMGTLVSPEPSWTWSATSEQAGNRWEILAACAPAISGITGNLFNQVASAQRLGTATYQPPAGDTVELTWMPQGIASPWVTGATADPGCDAVLIFSQDPPLVTGVGITQLSQTVTGIGLDCGSLPCCIPSGIGYQRITWSTVALPVTGFGGYELQRFDTTPGAQFETIMLASSPTVTGFNDFEARVGITSVYRIRTLNILNFAGPWSTYVSGAPPAPGVTGGCDDSTGALIFTSNAAQSGAYNAAYVAQWEGEPVEEFRLPEADMVRYQPMYQRDGMVAFHGTERGLEQFTRLLLIQAGAIDPIRLADVKQLRDLAWADLPYVCVRDDIGDRWFANVRVPTVNARQQRTKYFAQVQITELTTCPYAVDPS